MPSGRGIFDVGSGVLPPWAPRPATRDGRCGPRPGTTCGCSASPTPRPELDDVHTHAVMKYRSSHPRCSTLGTASAQKSLQDQAPYLIFTQRTVLV